MRKVLYSKEFCDSIVKDIEQFHPVRWLNRKKINSIPTKGDPTCDYLFAGHGSFPQEFKEALFKVAPVIEGYQCLEICINRYDPGMYMPEHVDVDYYKYNMVVNLTEMGDGIEVKGNFIEDVAGMATIFPRRSCPHAVPVVKHQRYILIFLYEL